MPNLVSTRARDPLRNYQFAVYLSTTSGAPTTGSAGDGRAPIAGVQRVSGLTFSVAPFDVWEGGNNLHRYANPDKVTWDPITLEQGIALDDVLETWAEGVRYFAMTGKLYTPEGASAPIPVKRDVTIELWDPVDRADSTAKVARRYLVKNAWISKYTAMPKLDALATETALLLVELVHEGWTMEARDKSSLTTPVPTSAIPAKTTT